MKTVRFYTSTGKYTGWEKFNCNETPKYRSWMTSGNSLRIGKYTLTYHKVFKTFRAVNEDSPTKRIEWPYVADSIKFCIKPGGDYLKD